MRIAEKHKYLQVSDNISQGGNDEFQLATATRGLYVRKDGTVELYDRENSRVIFTGCIPTS